MQMITDKSWPISGVELAILIRTGHNDNHIATLFSIGAWRVQKLRQKYSIPPCPRHLAQKKEKFQSLGHEKLPKQLLSNRQIDRLYRNRKYSSIQ